MAESWTKDEKMNGQCQMHMVRKAQCFSLTHGYEETEAKCELFIPEHTATKGGVIPACSASLLCNRLPLLNLGRPPSVSRESPPRFFLSQKSQKQKALFEEEKATVVSCGVCFL